MSPERVLSARRYKQMYQTTDPTVWRTRGGASLKIAEMEDGHLLNVVHWLRRQAAEYSVEVVSGKFSAHDLLMKAVPQYPTMVDELERRGRSDATPSEIRRRLARERRVVNAKAARPVAADAYARFAELIFDQ